MKKDFQKAAGLLSKVALVLAVFVAAQSSFANEALEAQDALPAQGRAILTVEDLQTLLGIKTRDPSSQAQMQQQDVVASAPIFEISMSAEERARIARALRRLNSERRALAEKLEAEKAKQVDSLRAERRSIQISRTRSSEETASLGQNLFASLLAEANAEAGVESALADFDQAHAIEVQYALNEEGLRHVAAIKVGESMVWANESLDRSMVARR